MTTMTRTDASWTRVARRLREALRRSSEAAPPSETEVRREEVAKRPDEPFWLDRYEL